MLGATFYATGDFHVDFLKQWFPRNYLYMAAPHLVVAIAGLLVRTSRPFVVTLLCTLSVALVLFYSFIWYIGEGGIAFVLYYPLAVFCFIGVAAYYSFRRPSPHEPS